MFILIASVFVMLLIGVPIGVAIGGSAIICTLVYHTVPMQYISQFMYAGLDSFTMLSLPFFMLCGTIMDVGGLSVKLVKAANAFVGNIKGGLGYVTILACMLFGGISGSAPATVAAIGAIMIPQMIRAGYNKYYATALVTVAGGLGVIVPPSFPLVLYGVTNSVSIGDLFIAGLGPALVVGLVLAIAHTIFAHKYNYKGSGEKFSLKNAGKAIWEAKWSLLSPVIILGGIYSGIFTPTEASVVACVYGAFVGIVLHKELTLKGLWNMFVDNMPFMGGLLITFPAAMQIASYISLFHVSDAVNGFFLSTSSSLFVTMGMIFIILLIAGMFIETTPITVILSPILLSVVKQYGMDPIQFGVVLLLGLCMAFVTPPVASNLFVASSMTGIGMEKIAKKSWPFLIMLVVAFFVICFVPEVSLFLVK